MQALDDVADRSELNDGAWDHLGAFFEGVYEWCQEYLAPALEIIRKIAEVVKSIVDVLSLIVGILSIFLPFLAPLAAALTLVSLGLAALILVCSLLLFVLGKESLGRVLSDAIGLATSVLTSKLGGLKIFSPGAKLAGFTKVLKPAEWVGAGQGMTAKFVTDVAFDGLRATNLEFAKQIALKVLKPDTLTIRLVSKFASDDLKNGLDFRVDAFPENTVGSWSEGSSMWDLTTSEIQDSRGKIVLNTLTGGAFSNIVKLTEPISFSQAAA